MLTHLILGTGLLVFSYNDEKTETEKLSNLSEITQLVNRGAKVLQKQSGSRRHALSLPTVQMEKRGEEILTNWGS